MNVERSIIDQNESKIIQAFLYDNTTYSSVNNKTTLDSVNYTLETNRPNGSVAKKEQL